MKPIEAVIRMEDQKRIKHPFKRRRISQSKVGRAVRKVLHARGVPIEPQRDTYKYYLKRGNKIVYKGITNDLDRREKEHQRKYGKGVRIHQVGNRTTREGAREWERKQK